MSGDGAMNKCFFSSDVIFESNTIYTADRAVYDIYPDESMESISCWWSSFKSDDKPLYASFVLRNLENITIEVVQN